MSRRDYPPNDRYDDRQSDIYRRPRTERDYGESDVDYRQSRYDGPAPAPTRRGEAAVRDRPRETDTVMTQGQRTQRGGPRQPDFLREDYGRNDNAGQLVVRDDRREEDDYVSRAPTRRRSLESVRSRGGPPPPSGGRGEKDEFVYRETDRSRGGGGPPYPRSERGSFGENDEVRYRDRRPQAQTNRGETREENIDIRFREDEKSDWRAPPREYRDRDDEEIQYRRSGGGGRGPPPARTEVDREEFTFNREERSRPPPPRTEADREEISYRDRVPYRGRESRKENIDIDIDVDINNRSAPPPQQRSMSRGALVRKVDEEWIVRKQRTPSPSPPPPPRDYEKEEIIIRRKERSPSPEPEPPREPTPEPPPPPQPEPVYRPPIIQEVITHHRHIDHGYERAREPTPPPAPAPPSPPKEEELEIQIHRQGTRNGKPYDENITLETETTERRNDNREISRRDDSRRDDNRRDDNRRDDNRRDVSRGDVSRQRSVSRSTRRRSPSHSRGRGYDDDVEAEADYYNRQISSRSYPGEAWNGATKQWELVDIPPGTERVRMDGAGGGRQEITWERYNGERRGKFFSGDQRYDSEYGNGLQSPAPPPQPLPPPESRRDDYRDNRSNETRINEDTKRGKTKEKMWTEVAKDLVIREAIEEIGYEYEENQEYFYVIEYLRYVSCAPD